MEKMCSELLHASEKISEDFEEIRTEMNIFHEDSKKIEDNMTLLKELKKLHETLEEVQIKTSLELSKIPPPSLLTSIQPTTPNSSRSNKVRTLTRKCSTSLLNRPSNPSITVDDLLKVILKRASQRIKVYPNSAKLLILHSLRQNEYKFQKIIVFDLIKFF